MGAYSRGLIRGGANSRIYGKQGLSDLALFLALSDSVREMNSCRKCLVIRPKTILCLDRGQRGARQVAKCLDSLFRLNVMQAQENCLLQYHNVIGAFEIELERKHGEVHMQTCYRSFAIVEDH